MPSRVLVVGAGPAGSTCAWKLASSGCGCTLVDGSTFPRGKVCGGATGARTRDLLSGEGMLTGAEFDRLAVRTHNVMSAYWKHDLLRTYRSPGPPVAILDRKSFDAALVDRAASAGAELVAGDRVVEVREGIALTRSGRRFTWDMLVGADGAVSTVRRSMFGRPRRRPGLGLQVTVPLPPGGDDGERGIRIHFGLVPYGYGWVFPRVSDCCIGMGALDHGLPASRLAESFAEFLLRLLGGDHPPPEGAVIPSLALHPSLGKGRVYLAGDAAGLSDQISGEGIAGAVESGFLVADSILSGDRKSMERKAAAGCVARVRLSSRYRHLLYSPLCQGHAMRRLRQKEKFFREFWNLVSGSTGYRGMMKRFLRD